MMVKHFTSRFEMRVGSGFRCCLGHLTQFNMLCKMLNCDLICSLHRMLMRVKSVQSALSDLLTTSATHDTFSRPSTKRGLILIGLELNTIQYNPYVCLYREPPSIIKKLVLLVSLLLKVLAKIIIIKKSPLFNHLNTKNKYLTSNKYFITKDLTST